MEFGGGDAFGFFGEDGERDGDSGDEDEEWEDEVEEVEAFPGDVFEVSGESFDDGIGEVEEFG